MCLRDLSSLTRNSVLSVHWKDWWWSWNSNTLATWCEELTRWKRFWCWERLREGGEGDDRGWDGWMASPTQWTWGSQQKRRDIDKGVDGDKRGIKRQNDREAEADGRVHWYESCDGMLLSVTQTPPGVFLKAQRWWHLTLILHYTQVASDWC